MLDGKETRLAGQGWDMDVSLSDAMTKSMHQKSEQHPSGAGWSRRLAEVDFVPDLGQDIGSVRWFRGLGTLIALSAAALALLPDYGPIYAVQPSMPTKAEFEEARAQMLMPIGYGSDSGKRMAASDAVVALADSPERPRIELTASLGRGDSFARLLQRSGVSGSEAANVVNMVSGATALSDIEPGTPIDIILGARPSKNQPRPLESVVFRARFDLNLEVNREGDSFRLNKKPINVDNTPLRIRGTVGSEGIARSARAAGAPARAIQDYLKVISGRTSLSSIRPTDQFDIIVDYKRAETGEVKVGDLLYAGVDRGGKSNIQMLKWTLGSNTQWFEASGVGESKGALSRPVNGPVTSSFGPRRHPILGYMRMHAGLDFKAGYGQPIFAVTDGVVAFAGRNGGYGNFVRLNHSGGLASGYGHMSRIVARQGSRVRRGQIIGYVGSTGLSTGPHLHYELYRNGRAVNPMSVTFTQRAQLSGGELVRFKGKLQSLKSVTPGAALTPLKTATKKDEAPKREIDRLTLRDSRLQTGG
ncbi:M23 family metallopeptidase [Sphingorhabdus sp.]|jgi:murein DD-endopeptidase MepM/ murein hydrolase activator NlpD|uniref:M23 family metallopeptidase n=1 Tax=Sphingorhabdus sp. TaxID=1902408 RepID=UPI0037837C48